MRAVLVFAAFLLLQLAVCSPALQLDGAAPNATAAAAVPQADVSETIATPALAANGTAAVGSMLQANTRLKSPTSAFNVDPTSPALLMSLMRCASVVTVFVLLWSFQEWLEWFCSDSGSYHYTLKQMIDSSHILADHNSGKSNPEYQDFVQQQNIAELHALSQQKWHEPTYTSAAQSFTSLLELSHQTGTGTGKLHSPMGTSMGFGQNSQTVLCGMWSQRTRLHIPIGGWFSVVGWYFTLKAWHFLFWMSSGIYSVYSIMALLLFFSNPQG